MAMVIPLLLGLLLGPMSALAQCNPATSVADPRIGVTDWLGTAGSTCYFPFTYGGSVFYDCDGSYCDGSFCGYWCATNCNYPSDLGAWRFCKFLVADLAKPNCSGLANLTASTEIEVYGGVGTGDHCYFPFMYNDVCYDDCIVTGGSPWCATTDVMYHVSTNQRFCRTTRKGLRDLSCAGLNSSTQVYLPPQIGNYSTTLLQSDPTGNCTFPFYYKEKCYDDCTTVDAQAWDLPWCLTEKYYDPNKRTRICPHYRRYKDVSGLALSWGFFHVRQYDSCASSGPACNTSWSLADSTVPSTSAGSRRMALSSTVAEAIEVMPQPNGLFILKLPQNCSANWNSVSLDGSDVSTESITMEREFWDIKATAKPNVFTVQSMRNSTRGMYLSYSTLSGSLVLSLSSGSVTQWRFDQLSNISIATLELPCENPTVLNGSWCAWSAYVPYGSMSTRNRSCACPPAIGGLPCVGNSSETAMVVNGTWCEWSAYSLSGSYSTRTRACNCSAPASGGIDCKGTGNETGLLVNGTWCEWSAFTIGSDGYGLRTRTCNCSAPEFGGADCAGPSNDTGLAVNGSWCGWSSYSFSGAHGTRVRVCNCSAPAYGGSDCLGYGNETGLMSNGTWCEWSAFTIGSDGYGLRTRTCNCSAPGFGGADCAGLSNETGLAVNGSWCGWSPFSISGAYGTRTRTCNCSAPKFGGTECSGARNETGLSTNGTWCEWSAFTIGSDGYGLRTRMCNCSAPEFGGINCTGPSNETGLAVNGTWCGWSPFEISGSYGTRARACNCSAPVYGGSDCPGYGNETGLMSNGTWCEWTPFVINGTTGTRSRACNCSGPAFGGSDCPGPSSDAGLVTNGAWCSWSAYRANGSYETRSRICKCSAAAYGGSDCAGSSSQISSIVSGVWCSWSAWANDASAVGVVSRTRTCSCPSPSTLGASCSGLATELGSCTTSDCIPYAQPQEAGSQGASLSNLDAYRKLVAWAVIICLSMLACAAVGLGLMLNHISQVNSVVASLPPIFSDYESYNPA